ncbi:hypothetical protein BpHYR1_048914 [Brachionus plicatilis]|uniref:Uncharacterized protein n=1 Tax=Brachionus plicatilis TaxID=10195 RepID=A0A3M7S124_BRAPC|nr:hypothetical protein BpHYR1_048914 [Brachionus plicatilis]
MKIINSRGKQRIKSEIEIFWVLVTLQENKKKHKNLTGQLFISNSLNSIEDLFHDLIYPRKEKNRPKKSKH